MTKATLWDTTVGDRKADMAFINNSSATTDPGVNDDANDGYSIGSQWVNTSADTVWFCADATAGAAVWKQMAAPASDGDLAVTGDLFVGGQQYGTQGAPVAKTVSSTLTAANLLAGIITVNQAGGAVSTQTLPTGTDMQAALPASFGVNSYFEFTVINTSTVDAEDAALASPGASFTIVGSVDVPAHSGITIVSSGTFRVRKTADNTFVAYRK